MYVQQITSMCKSNLHAAYIYVCVCVCVCVGVGVGVGVCVWGVCV